MKNNFSFKVLKKDKNSRLGKIITSRGQIDTPAFMPVGTQGTIKGIYSDDIKNTGTQIILGNTYHLMLRPGVDVLKQFNGIHKFMNWDRPILTDSGGYQIMSLSKFNKIDKKLGAIFRSHLDGKKIILSPEKSIQIQKDINSDILMVLDECPKLTRDKKILSNAIDISTNWAKRSKVEFGKNNKKALFGITQGGLYQDLRIESLEKLKEIGFDGYAIGGMAVGETQSQMFYILENFVKFLPENKPRYLMGVGMPGDILGAVKNGVDMFDCVLPTRSGRTGLAFTWQGKINLKNSKYRHDKSPLDRKTKIRNLSIYSKSYLNHLIKSNEILASMLISLHNVNFYQELMREIRKNIKKGSFLKFYNKYIKVL
ncbi:MAG: tRNA guanosine(34) transglycosylase Tgt [Pelagibacteraceae bacterium TMED216]|nr:MAG: tRNA guanosine(34) transglycosylase Tgt [Pelagibacteraceae bacterium TMED216]|tara:strand:+ start:1776 stop:2885 length:1110 start_codon:yes stop_codon:yes gene_type:complete